MKIHKTLIFIWSVIALLAFTCFLFPEEGIALNDKTLYFPKIEDILNDSTDGHTTSVLERIKRLEESIRIQQQKDSVYADSMAVFRHFFETHPFRIDLPDNDWTYLHSFFQALDSCHAKNQTVRILHYGDSQIEADRITGVIRRELQQRFGGSGPGLLPAVQVIPSYAVGQTASENITRYMIAGSHKIQAPHRRYGAMGQVGSFSGNASISVNARNNKDTHENVKTFQQIRLYTSPTINAQLVVKEDINPNIENPEALKVFSWNLSEPINHFTVKLSGNGEVYGISADGECGIAVDNIPFRGSSGTFFVGIDSVGLKSMYEELNVQLILLQFGGNIMPAVTNDKQIERYKSSISNQIQYLKKIRPDAKIILIGPSDMSKKIGGKLQTYPYLEKVVAAMRSAALESGAGFWSIYDVMGGRNSMIDWVKSSPKLAAPDYIHFTNRGTERVAHLFCESFMRYYEYYQFDSSHPK